eukprot:SAG11_NODE_2316_length_3532_cov_45.795514_1_plen_92_part_00
MTVSEAPDSERAIRHTRLEPSSSLPHPKLPPRSQHADNRTQCEVYRERDPETDSGYGFENGSRRLLIILWKKPDLKELVMDRVLNLVPVLF